jgi:hypothetical protein
VIWRTNSSQQPGDCDNDRAIKVNSFLETAVVNTPFYSFLLHSTHLIVRELVSDVGHEVLELCGRDAARPSLVKHPERRPDEVLVVDRVHLFSHHVAKLGKLDEPGTVCVELQEEDVMSEIRNQPKLQQVSFSFFVFVLIIRVSMKTRTE